MAVDTKGGFGEIMSMVRGFQVAKMLMVAVDLGVFDFLEEPRSAVEAAAKLRTDERATGIFLNGLAALGVITKGVDYFQNSEAASRYLVRGKDGYRGTIIAHMHHTWKRGWNELETTIYEGLRDESRGRFFDALENLLDDVKQAIGIKVNTMVPVRVPDFPGEPGNNGHRGGLIKMPIPPYREPELPDELTLHKDPPLGFDPSAWR